MTTVVNERDKSLQNTTPRLTATSVVISSTGASFLKQKNGGAVTPTSITLSAITTVFTNASLSWEYALSTDPSTWVAIGSPVLTGATIAALVGTATTITYRVTATQPGFLSATNTFLISFTKEADEPIVVKQSRSTVSIPVDAAGTPKALTNTGNVISVRRGTTDLTYNATNGANTFYVSTATLYPPASLTLGIPTGSGTTVTFPDILSIGAYDAIIVTYTIVCRDASGIIITPNFTLEQNFSKLYGNNGTDAYHIRFDNESRIINCEYTGAIKSGILPLTAQTYITKGGIDITTGFSVIYTVNSTSNCTATVNGTTGSIQVNTVTADIAYVEVKADITLIDSSHLMEYRKLYLYKVKDGSLAADLNITSDQARYDFADSTSTTSTSAWSIINFTASIAGIVPMPTVTWSTKAYDIAGTELSPGMPSQLTINGNTATMSPAQFVARGGASARFVAVTASYNSGFQTMEDSAFIYRSDGTGGYAVDTTANYTFTYRAEIDGSITALELAKESCNTAIIRLSDLADVTNGWTFTVSSSSGTAYVNGTADPYTSNGEHVVITMNSIPSGIASGTITITATHATLPTTVGHIEWTVSMPVSDGYTHYFDPKNEITIYVDSLNNPMSYTDAFTYFKVLKGGLDDTASWTFTKVDGPGVTSTLTT